jgi:subfamily B ATP-binding cassette protein MsbA
MRELFRYFRFALAIGRSKIIIFFVLAALAATSQSLATACILSAISHGAGFGENNFVFRTIMTVARSLPLSNNANSTLGLLLAMTGFLFGCSGVVLMFGEWYKSRFLGNLYIRMQKETMDELYKTDYQTFLKYNIGDLSNIVIEQLRIMVQSLRIFITVVSSIIFTIAYLVLPFLVNFKIALFAMLVLMPMAIVIRRISRKLKQISLDTVAAKGGMNGTILQILSNYRYLKSTGTYPRTYVALDKTTRKNAELMVQIAVWGGVTPNIMTPLAIIVICALTFWQVAICGIPIIDACATLGLLYHAAQQAITIPTTYQKFLSAAGAIDVYQHFREDISKNKEQFYKRIDNLKKPDFSGEIRLDNVSFSYGDSEKLVLRDLSISIPSKSLVGFVGESGSGKSTLINIIIGLLKPLSGTMSLSEIPYDEMDMEDFRKKIAYVTQEPVIFRDSILDNITLWEPSPNREKLVSVTKKASAEAFIGELIGKYDAMLGDDGVNISGGQRQRVSIARELYKDAAILLLDEATSALDSETEQAIQENLKKIHGTKTIIVIAHRLSTIKDCDKIFVMEKGQIIEHGNFENLIAKGGKFKDMVDRQSL